MNRHLEQLLRRMGMSLSDFQQACDIHNIDWPFVAAICAVESMGDPHAVRYEAHYRWLFKPAEFAKRHRITKATETQLQKMSWGPFQLMGALLRELGYPGPLTAMTDPQLNMAWALVHLLALKRKYSSSDKVAAAYNAGKPRRKLLTGEYKNQAYVNKVLHCYEDFKADVIIT